MGGLKWARKIRAVALSDNELLNFDASKLGMADAGDARRLLANTATSFAPNSLPPAGLTARHRGRHGMSISGIPGIPGPRNHAGFA